jgi:hypothetical protein
MGVTRVIRRLSASEFSEHFLRGQGSPAIIEGELDEWHFEKYWTPEYLASLARDRPVTVSESVNGTFNYSQATEMADARIFERRDVRFGDAVQAVLDPQNNRNVYILGRSIPTTLPELQRHIVVPRWIESWSEGGANGSPAINLWLGRATKTPLHFDAENNFFAQLYGTKQFTIFSPLDTANLYPFPLGAAAWNNSCVDAYAPDVERYPRFSAAVPLTFEVKAGDLLFLPAYWWHQVRSVDVSVSVNFWTSPRPSQLFSCPNSLRILYSAYERDRLAWFNRSHLQPLGLDFITAAQLFSRENATWAASLCALAAFDQLTQPNRPDRSTGCSLLNLSEDLRAISSKLALDDAVRPEHRHTLLKIPQFAALAAQCDDSLLLRSDVRELLKAVSALNKRGNDVRGIKEVAATT